MNMPGVLNDLGQNIIPDVFSALAGAGLGETVTIAREQEVSDGGGSSRKTWTNQYENILVPPIKSKSGNKFEAGMRLVSVTEYEITLPATSEGTLLDVKVNDRIIVTARGQEPQRTFRIENIAHKSGVVNVATCYLEN